MSVLCTKFLDSKNNTCYLYNTLIHGNCKYCNPCSKHAMTNNNNLFYKPFCQV